MAKKIRCFPIISVKPPVLYQKKYDENALLGLKCQASKAADRSFF